MKPEPTVETESQEDAPQPSRPIFLPLPPRE